MHRTLFPAPPRRPRLPRFLRRRQPVPASVLAALCAELAAPIAPPARRATAAQGTEPEAPSERQTAHGLETH